MSAYELFPMGTSVSLSFPFKRDVAYQIIRQGAENGVEQSRVRSPNPRRAWSAAVENMPKTERDALVAFFSARQAAAESFLLDDPREPDITAEAVGTGDGSVTAFPLARRYVDSSTCKVYLGGVLQVSGYTLADDDGIVTFATPPGVGVAVTADYRRRFRVRFAADTLTLTEKAYCIYNGELGFVEVLP